jgi:transposase
MSWQMMDVERLIEPEHPARAIWELVGRLKLDGLYAPIEAVEGTAGRTPWDPRLLVSLWIYAYSRGISSARELARRCSYEPAFQWLCGLGEINHHTLSDFRVDHDAGLRELFVQVLGVLSSEGLVSLERVMHDGTRIKACAGADSFRREQRLQEHLEAARKQVEAMADPRQEEPARKRAARGGSDYGHLIGAVAQVEANLGQKPAQVVVDGGFTSRENIMAMAEQGVDFIGSLPAANPSSANQQRQRGVTEQFSLDKFRYDAQQDTYRCPAGESLRHKGREFSPGVVIHQYRAKPETCAACQFRSQCCPGNQHHGRSVVRAEHSAVVRQFAEKMETEEGKAIYRQRGAVAEFPNAWIKEKLGLRQFRVRGLAKALMEVLWACLTYNIQQWIRLSWRPGLAGAKN